MLIIILGSSCLGIGETCSFTSPYSFTDDEIEKDFIPSSEWVMCEPTTTKGGDVFIDADCHSEDDV